MDCKPNSGFTDNKLMLGLEVNVLTDLLYPTPRREDPVDID